MRSGRLGLALLLAGLACLGGTTGVARSATGPAQAGVRPWGGTWIRSLDPAPARLADVPAGSAPIPGEAQSDRVLSDERRVTRWANVRAISAVRERPDASAKRITSLHSYTEDDFPEVYLVLRSHADQAGRQWIQVRVPMRPNGRVGWVRREALGAFHVTHTAIVVDRSRLRMTLLVNGRKRWSAPVGIGRRRTPTPAGHFWIRERFKITDRSSGYWPYAFGTSDYSTLSDWPGGGVVGIHGPYHQASLIPGRVSHGCIRLRKADTAWLARHITLGTPLLVR